MLTINLLPPEHRKETLSPVEQFHRTPLMALVVGVFVSLPLACWAPIAVRQSQLRALNVKISALEPRKTELDRVQQFLKNLLAQETAFQGLAKGEGLWSQRLNTLSDAVPDGLWFTDLTIEPAKGLIVQGAAVGEGGPSLVNTLVKHLKDAPEFMAALKGIQIDSIKRVQAGGLELTQFTFSCALAEAPAS